MRFSKSLSTEKTRTFSLVDNLPVATPMKESETEMLYDHGYKLGNVKEDKVNRNRSNRIMKVKRLQTHLNNHLEFLLKYHEPEPGKYRVVGFEVYPMSIDHRGAEGDCAPTVGPKVRM